MFIGHWTQWPSLFAPEEVAMTLLLAGQSEALAVLLLALLPAVFVPLPNLLPSLCMMEALYRPGSPTTWWDFCSKYTQCYLGTRYQQITCLARKSHPFASKGTKLCNKGSLFLLQYTNCLYGCILPFPAPGMLFSFPPSLFHPNMCKLFVPLFYFSATDGKEGVQFCRLQCGSWL